MNRVKIFNQTKRDIHLIVFTELVYLNQSKINPHLKKVMT
jgi:hypothetical protein